MLKFSHVSFWRIENNIFRVKCAPSFHIISILSMNLETKNGTWIICIYIWRPTCPRLYLPSHPHQYFLIYQPWSNNFRWQCSSSCRSFWAVWPAGCGCSQQVADLWGYTIQGWGKRNVHLWYADTPVLSASSSVISTFIKMCFFIFLTSKRFSVAFLNAFLYFMVIFTVWEQIRGGIKTLAAISQREMPVSGSEQRARCSADQNYKEVICDSDAVPACDEASNNLRSSYVKLATPCGEEGNSVSSYQQSFLSDI